MSMRETQAGEGKDSYDQSDRSHVGVLVRRVRAPIFSPADFPASCLHESLVQSLSIVTSDRRTWPSN